MFNFDYITKEDIKEHYSKWQEISDHPYKIGGFGSGKTNGLLNLINHEPDIDMIYLYAKDPYGAKYQLLINKRESTILNYLKNPKVFIEYSNDMDDIYKNIEEQNPNKNRKILIVFDNMIDNVLSYEKLNQVVLNYLLEEENEIFLLFL